MPWITLTSADVLAEFTPAEAAALNAIQGATDRLPGILDKAVAAARGSIRAGGYQVGDDGTIPDQISADVISIARWRWLVSFPQLQRLQTKERSDANKDALARLDRVSLQQLAIEPPAGAGRGGRRAGNWNSENKLIPRTHPIPPPATQYPPGDANRPYANPRGPRDT